MHQECALMETPVGRACVHCSRRIPPARTTGEVQEPLATTQEEAQWAKGTPAKGSWKPKQEPSSNKPGKRVRRGGHKKNLAQMMARAEMMVKIGPRKCQGQSISSKQI